MDQHSKRTKARHSTHTTTNGTRSFSALFKESALGTGAAMGIAAVLLFGGAAICCATKDPNRLILPVGLIALFLSSLMGGWIATRQSRCQALLHGAISGGLLVLVFWFLTIFLKRSETEFFSIGLSLLLRGMTVICSILGAYLGAKTRTKSRHR